MEWRGQCRGAVFKGVGRVEETHPGRCTRKYQKGIVSAWDLSCLVRGGGRAWKISPTSLSSPHLGLQWCLPLAKPNQKLRTGHSGQTPWGAKHRMDGERHSMDLEGRTEDSLCIAWKERASPLKNGQNLDWIANDWANGMANDLTKKIFKFMLAVRKISLALWWNLTSVDREVKNMGFSHIAGGKVKYDRWLESSNSTPGNLSHRNKGPDKEGHMCKKIAVDAVIPMAAHLLNSLSLYLATSLCWNPTSPV